MTNQQHPITPPLELMRQWLTEGHHQDYCSASAHAIAQAAQWGADQELEACVKAIKQVWEMVKVQTVHDLVRELRAARRSKPPSLKEQALEALQFVDEKLDLPLHNHCNAIHTIRKALEALPND